MAQFEIHSLGRAKLAGKCNAYIVRATAFNNMNPIGMSHPINITFTHMLPSRTSSIISGQGP